MKLLFKQRFFSWFDSYDIYDENNETIYQVQGKLAWGHCLHIYDANNNFLGKIKEEILTFLPRFAMYINEEYIGCIKKEFTFFKPVFHIDYNGWSINGDFFEWDYEIIDSNGDLVASVYKELFHFTDTYVIDVKHAENAFYVLMVVLAIDAEKCSRG